jgi:hypothetical protein
VAPFFQVSALKRFLYSSLPHLCLYYPRLDHPKWKTWGASLCYFGCLFTFSILINGLVRKSFKTSHADPQGLTCRRRTSSDKVWPRDPYPLLGTQSEWDYKICHIMSVHAPARLHGTSQLLLNGFSIFDIWLFFQNMSWNFSFINIWKEYRVIQTVLCTLNIESGSNFLKMRCFKQKLYKTQDTHFVFNNFFSEHHDIYETMWKNNIEPDKPQMTIQCMHIACWITNATDI